MPPNRHDQLRRHCEPPVDRRHAGVPLQPENVSNRACAVVIDSISRYPQDSSGPTALIAHEITRPDRAISIIQAAQILPDPDFCQERVSAIYRAFGAEYKYGAAETIYTVLRFAMYGLNRARKVTLDAARSLEVDTQDEPFAHTPISENPNQDAQVGAWQIDVVSAYSLDAFLGKAPEVAAAINNSLHSVAAITRRGAKRQQATARRILLAHQQAPHV